MGYYQQGNKYCSLKGKGVFMLIVVDGKKIGNANAGRYKELENLASPTGGSACFLMKQDGEIFRFKGFLLREDRKKGWFLNQPNGIAGHDAILVHKYVDIIAIGESLQLYPVMDCFGFFGGFVNEFTKKICDCHLDIKSASVDEYIIIDDADLILYNVRIFSVEAPDPCDFDLLNHPKGFLVTDGENQRLVYDGEIIDCSQVAGKIKIDPIAERLMESVLLKKH